MASFKNEDFVSLLVFFHSFATAVKYQVALADDIVVAETQEGGVEFHVKDGIIVDLYCYFISLNREYNSIFHLIVCVTTYYYFLKVIFFRDCQE